jgi:hypothetical protein
LTAQQPRQGHLTGSRTPAHAGSERTWYMSWREAELWERPVIDRAYQAGAEQAAELVQVSRTPQP